MPCFGVSLMSMDLGFRSDAAAGEIIEVAAFVGLQDMIEEHRTVAARIMGRRGDARLPPSLQRGRIDQQIESPPFGIEADEIAIAHQAQRPADATFRRYVQNAGAI